MDFINHVNKVKKVLPLIEISLKYHQKKFLKYCCVHNILRIFTTTIYLENQSEQTREKVLKNIHLGPEGNQTYFSVLLPARNTG